jgi:hypothetical protein
MGKFRKELKMYFNPKYLDGTTDWDSGETVRGQCYYNLAASSTFDLTSTDTSSALNSLTSSFVLIHSKVSISSATKQKKGVKYLKPFSKVKWTF